LGEAAPCLGRAWRPRRDRRRAVGHDRRPAL